MFSIEVRQSFGVLDTEFDWDRQFIWKNLMCRHAAYIGPPVTLEQFLLRPSHGLLKQSYRPKEMNSATVNADGFGFGWYLEDGTLRQYNNPAPIWSDPNIVQLGPALKSGVWLANVRSATIPCIPTLVNTPPYGIGHLLFSHNGFIDDFARSVRTKFRGYLYPEIEAEIKGNTDSEYLFALIRQMLMENKDILEVFERLFTKVRTWMEGGSGSFNFLMTDGERIFATRYSIGHDAPSLYLGRDDNSFSGGWFIASEPFSDCGEWSPVDKCQVIILSAGSEPEKMTI